MHPGVFVSNLSTAAWEPDPEVGGEMHVLCTGVGVEAGLSRFIPGSEPVVRWTLHGRPSWCLKGPRGSRLGAGPTLELKVGDMASLPSGAEAIWHLTLPFKEFWVTC